MRHDNQHRRDPTNDGRGLIVDCFAGPGGWSHGLRAHHLTDVGIEWDGQACATRAAAGHPTVRADVAALPTGPSLGKVWGLISSPPCTAFSQAGTGQGRKDIPALLAATSRVVGGASPADLLPHLDPLARLALEPARWAVTQPQWIALEQVPSVLPLWVELLRCLRPLGYSGWAGVLNAADFGVPQTRRRAVLVARLGGGASRPAATHTGGDRADDRDALFGSSLPGWRSMADTNGWPAGWVLRNGMNTMRVSRDPQDMVPYERPVGRPAPTLDGKVGGAWKVGPVGSHVDPPHRWKNRRPEPDPDGTGRVPPAGPREGRARALTLEEAGALQTFPPDYPWQGGRGARFKQLGNAVPPLFAAHIVAAAAGLPAPTPTAGLFGPAAEVPDEPAAAA